MVKLKETPGKGGATPDKIGESDTALKCLLPASLLA